jgi:adenylate cyclase
MPAQSREAAAEAAAVPQDLDVRSAALGARLESNVALVGMALAAFVTATLGGLWLSGRPVVVPNVGMSLVALVWYTADWTLIRRGHYRPWFRYASCAFEVTLPTIVIFLDHELEGPMSAYLSVGVPLYALTVSASALRLDRRLSIFAGTLAAAEFLVLFLVVAPPASDPRLADLLTARWHVTAIKASYVFGVGIIGMVGAVAISSLLRRATRQAAERERVRRLFALYVSEEIVRQVLDGKVKEGGERRRATILFADVRGFTALTATRPPEEVLSLLNRYLDRMCAIVARHGGVVNKFVGDGMLVVFGAPNALDDDAGAALAAAREMAAEAARLAATGELPGVAIGIGMHRGDVVAGNLGGSQRQEYAVIGDTVNTASRVEGIAKTIGRTVVLSEAVRAALKAGGADDLEALGTHAVRGRGASIALFAPRAAA